MALDLTYVDNRLNGSITICRPESLILSCMLRRVHLCARERILCSYGHVLAAFNDSDYQRLRLRTWKRISLSMDEFIEILGEAYYMSAGTVESMPCYLQASEIMDVDTNVIRSRDLTYASTDDMIKYVLREDAIRRLIKLLADRTRRDAYDSFNERVHYNLILPDKFNDLYRSVKKLSSYSERLHVPSSKSDTDAL